MDYVFAVRRVLRTLQPSVVIVAETEIWPNLFRETKRTGAALAVVNGRISDRAFPRYLPFRRFFAAVLPHADAILAQTEAIRERFWRWARRPSGPAPPAISSTISRRARPPPDSPVTELIAADRARAGVDRRQHDAAGGRGRPRRG